KQLLIYDPEISDPGMLRILEARAQAGVEIRVIGRVSRRSPKLAVRKLSITRLHTRTIIRDGKQAFIGSQSLRELELGARREVGVVFRDKKMIANLVRVFQDDWDAMERSAEQQPQDQSTPVVKVAKKVAKVVT